MISSEVIKEDNGKEWASQSGANQESWGIMGNGLRSNRLISFLR